MRNSWFRNWLASAYFASGHILRALLRKFFGSKLESTVIGSLAVLSGQFDPRKISLFSIVKNEIVLLPAFLDHHRSIGVEQFLVLVDYSDDGTLELLLSQSDVVVLTSDIKFGDFINVSILDRFGFTHEDHAGKILKEVITQKFFHKTYGLYADADEFLFLPEAVSSLREVIDFMAKKKMKSITASVVEFFPENVDGLREAKKFDSLASLIANYPYFERQPLLRLRKGCFAKEVHPAKTTELIAAFLGEYGLSVRLKTPIVFHNVFSFRIGAHFSSLPPPHRHMLTVGHFKLTFDSFNKFNEVTESRPHPPNTNRKYDLLQELLQVMDEQSASFLSEKSTRFETTDQFVQTGLMKWGD